MITETDLEHVKMAAMHAQARQEKALQVPPSPYAVPIIWKALIDAAPQHDTVQSLVDAQLHGRLRGYTITELQHRGITLQR